MGYLSQDQGFHFFTNILFKHFGFWKTFFKLFLKIDGVHALVYKCSLQLVHYQLPSFHWPQPFKSPQQYKSPQPFKSFHLPQTFKSHPQPHQLSEWFRRLHQLNCQPSTRLAAKLNGVQGLFISTSRTTSFLMCTVLQRYQMETVSMTGEWPIHLLRINNWPIHPTLLFLL